MGRRAKDTIPDSILTTRELVISPGPSGQALGNGFVNGQDDQDWFRIELRAGETYRFSAATVAAFGPTLSLRDAAGVELSVATGGVGGEAALFASVATDGTYYLDVGGSGRKRGAYSVTALETPADVGTFATVAVSAGVSGDIQDADDRDWFAVTLVAGQRYLFEADQLSGALIDATLALRDADGALLAFVDGGGEGGDAVIEFLAPSPGIYFLDVGGNDGAAGSYTVFATADDVSGTTATTATIDPLGGFVVGGGGNTNSGTIGSPSDQDFFRTELVANEGYRFIGTAGSLAIRDAAGALIVLDTDDSIIDFVPTLSGTYFIDVGNPGATTGAYTLSASLLDIPDAISTFARFTVGTSRSSTIESAADQDWFGGNLSFFADYIFEVTGGFDPTLGLRNGNGALVLFNDDVAPGVLGSRIEVEFLASGFYFLDVGGFGSSTGAYTLTGRIDDAADDIYTTDVLNLPFSISGNVTSAIGSINSGADQDFYEIVLTASGDYGFFVDGIGLSDPTLALRDGAGNLVAFNDDTNGLDPAIFFTATVTGTYYLDVGSFADLSGSYELTARQFTEIG